MTREEIAALFDVDPELLTGPTTYETAREQAAQERAAYLVKLRALGVNTDPLR